MTSTPPVIQSQPSLLLDISNDGTDGSVTYNGSDSMQLDIVEDSWKCYREMKILIQYSKNDGYMCLEKMRKIRDESIPGTMDQLRQNDEKLNFTLLHEASESGFVPIFEFLIELGWEISNLTSAQFHCLHLAAFRGRTDLVKHIIEKYNINPSIQHPENGTTPLLLAVRNGKMDCAKYLIEQKKVPLDECTFIGRDSLDMAAGWGHPELLIYLIDLGADINALRGSLRPIHSATYFQNIQCIQILCEAKCDIDALSKTGKAAINIALEQKRRRAIQQLIANGANIDLCFKNMCVRNSYQFQGQKMKRAIDSGLSRLREKQDNLQKAVMDVDSFLPKFMRLKIVSFLLCPVSLSNVNLPLSKRMKIEDLEVIFSSNSTCKKDGGGAPEKT